MKLKTHAAMAVAASPFLAFTPVGFHFLLFGAGFPDVDLVGYKYHRNSPFHTIEYSLAALAVSLVLPFSVYVKEMAFCFSAGWVIHLLGDFLQGGVKSVLFRKKIGFKKFKWEKYYGTPAGFLIDFVFYALALLGAFRFFTAFSGRYAAAISLVLAFSGGGAIGYFAKFFIAAVVYFALPYFV